MKKKTQFAFYLRLAFLTIALLPLAFVASSAAGLEGRWDLVIQKDGQELPSWLEIERSGHTTLVGRFVYAFGSARPISVVNVTGPEDKAKFSFSIPPQWEEGNRNMDFAGQRSGDKILGTMVYTDGKTYNWSGSRAPLLKRISKPKWGKPISLFNGKDLKGWHPTTGESQWRAEGGILRNLKSGANLVSDQVFIDFKLHVEFRYEKNGNSGVYLRGRYEVQIEDDKGKEPSKGYLGSIYGFLAPSEMTAKNPGEWQTYDITLIGRRVSVVANGVTVISNQEIPGITGGALDSKEGEPGPIFLQGDHGPIDYRNIVITPAR